MRDIHRSLFKQLSDQGCFDELFEQIKGDYLNRIATTTPEEKEKREEYYNLIHSLKTIKTIFKNSEVIDE